MNQKEFKHQFLGEFIVDERYRALVERLEQYYRDTPDTMSNRDALPHWKEFNRWCDQHGYTRKEINNAKRDARYD